MLGEIGTNMYMYTPISISSVFSPAGCGGVSMDGSSTESLGEEPQTSSGMHCNY